MQSDLRSVMRHFATGVCVVTTFSEDPGGRRHDAVTVNSFTSVSLDPPLVSLCLRSDSRFLADMVSSGVWAVSILAAGSEHLARALAQDRDARAGTVGELVARPGAHTGALVLDAPSWLECRLRDHVRVGDHVLVIGEAVATGVDDGHSPLIFLHGGFHILEGIRT
jgi:flavin reductase (DIM6/NTAB) family NADH-FMN oxidoreductase RutF